MTPLLTVRDLTVEYARGSLFSRAEPFRAVDGVNLAVRRGACHGVVGESGSGKTTLARAVLGVAPVTGGQVTFQAQADRPFAVHALTRSERRRLCAHVQMVFQDPYASLSPRMSVRDIIAEPLEAMRLTGSRGETDRRVREVAAQCRIDPAHLTRYPHAFSGGQRQRIAIARAIAPRPELLICDEAVAALDVSIQADILNLLVRLRDEYGLTILFISHDLAVVGHVCDRVTVMQSGRVVEEGATREVIARPREDYTRRLIAAVPRLRRPAPAPASAPARPV